MTKISYEEWKKEYCTEISKETLQQLKTLHNIETPEELIEQYMREAYDEWIGEITNEPFSV